MSLVQWSYRGYKLLFEKKSRRKNNNLQGLLITSLQRTLMYRSKMKDLYLIFNVKNIASQSNELEIFEHIFAYLTISKGYLSYFIPQGIHPGYA